MISYILLSVSDIQYPDFKLAISPVFKEYPISSFGGSSALILDPTQRGQISFFFFHIHTNWYKSKKYYRGSQVNYLAPLPYLSLEQPRMEKNLSSTCLCSLFHNLLIFRGFWQIWMTPFKNRYMQEQSEKNLLNIGWIFHLLSMSLTSSYVTSQQVRACQQQNMTSKI